MVLSEIIINDCSLIRYTLLTKGHGVNVAGKSRTQITTHRLSMLLRDNMIYSERMGVLYQKIHYVHAYVPLSNVNFFSPINSLKMNIVITQIMHANMNNLKSFLR